MIPDDELVYEYLNGNDNSFKILYKRYEKNIFKIIEKFGFDEKDISQEIWISVVNKLKLYKQKNFKSWLMTLCKNECIDIKRKPKKELYYVVNETPDVLDKLNFDTLTQIEIEILLLRLKGLKFYEITRLLKIPHGTILSNYRNMIIKLRQQILKNKSIEYYTTNLKSKKIKK